MIEHPGRTGNNGTPYRRLPERRDTAVYHNKIAVSSRENLFFRRPETNGKWPGYSEEKEVKGGSSVRNLLVDRETIYILLEFSFWVYRGKSSRNCSGVFSLCPPLLIGGFLLCINGFSAIPPCVPLNGGGGVKSEI